MASWGISRYRANVNEIDSANGNVLSITQVIGQTDPAGGETNDLKTQFLYTANPTGTGQVPGGMVTSITDPEGAGKGVRNLFCDFDQLIESVAPQLTTGAVTDRMTAC